MRLKEKLLHEFQAHTGVLPRLSDDFESAFGQLGAFLETRSLRPPDARKRWLFARINWKFRTNRHSIARLYATAAKGGVTFNFHQKARIQSAFDLLDRDSFAGILRTKRLPANARKDLEDIFAPVDERTTLETLHKELRSPSKLRVRKGDRPIDQEILQSCLGAFVFSAAEEQTLHEFFDPRYSSDTYEHSFWLHLRRLHPTLYSRNRALDVIRISGGRWTERYEEGRKVFLALVRDSYKNLNNYGHLAIWIDPVRCATRNVTWELASDLMLFAEKHDPVRLENAYFRPEKIRRDTLAKVPDIDAEEARFELANEGFTYRDTFVFASSPDASMGTESLLLVFQKNTRDETLVPCPACRSHEIQGNSYSTLGVRAWECRNPLCPDRSKYNRGKRYSFKNILMQEAIEDERSQIPAEAVRSWMRDVHTGRNFRDALELAVSHYTLHSDVVHVFGTDEAPGNLRGRRIENHPLKSPASSPEPFFESAPWFRRYIVERGRHRVGSATGSGGRIGRVQVVHGEAQDVLLSFEADSIDGAVTSPPYYNAREYSQWPNMYGYLHEMYAAAREVYRVLRPGGFYLYNIFDYFDNERTVVYSAMGDKRLVLSAYTVDLFRRAGFLLMGNVAWDKGHIEGRRGFNGGNFSPYYQSPFNCWEHVLVFWKPDGNPKTAKEKVAALPSVLREHPVVKLLHGTNTHGHTAPFPEAVPKLLVPLLPEDAVVLDPFAGSGTTGRSLREHAQRVVCIEKDEAYCKLALEKCSEPRQEELDLPPPMVAAQ